MANPVSFSYARELGSGRRGRVFLLTSPLVGSLALKTPKRQNHEASRMLIINEASILSSLTHPNIVAYRGFITQPFGYLQEACPRGNLRSMLQWFRTQQKPLPETFVRTVFCQMILTLDYCHSPEHRGYAVIHRDIRPANILLGPDGRLRLIDFGCAVLAYPPSVALTAALENPRQSKYRAPELRQDLRYTSSVDVYSLGKVLQECISSSCSLPPGFRGRTTFSRSFSTECQRMIQSMVSEAGVRPSARDILLHPFFNTCFEGQIKL